MKWLIWPIPNEAKNLEIKKLPYTVCFADLDQCREMIIFKSILTTLIASNVFKGSWVNSEKLKKKSLKLNNHKQI